MASEAPRGDYVLDPAHTSIVWSLKHAGLSNYTARFDTAQGALTFDPDNPKNSRVDIRIDPASINTGDSEFDDEITNKGSYFGADKYGEIRFISTSIKITGENTGEITGELTFRGQTHPLTLGAILTALVNHSGIRVRRSGFGAR